AVEFMTQYFRYLANLGRLGQKRVRVGAILRAADLVAPAQSGMSSHELSALALLVREWSADPLPLEHPLVSFLLLDNLTVLPPLLPNTSRGGRVKLPLPRETEIGRGWQVLAPSFPRALTEVGAQLPAAAGQLRGASLNSIESLLKRFEYQRAPLRMSDLA